jgi:3-oxoacyl-[acyl-carrier protein] reductase
MDLGITGKTALVMSAGGGLGSAIAVALAREGARVVVSDRSEEALGRTVARIRDTGGQAVGIAADLRELNSLDRLVEAARRAFGDPDILVNNSGGPAPSAVADVASDVWRGEFDAMVLSLMHLADLVLPSMRVRGWGRIITSTSSGVIVPIANLGVSNTLRAALLGWSKTLANEVACDGVCVNVVLPGRIATDRIRALDEAKAGRENRSVDAVAAQSIASIPVGRYGTPEEYGDTVAFLASTRASFINGSVIRVDGGMIPSI